MVVLCLIVGDISKTASNTEGNIQCGNFVTCVGHELSSVLFILLLLAVSVFY
jgi:hypothetical protein